MKKSKSILLGDSPVGRAWAWLEIALYAASPALLIQYLLPQLAMWLLCTIYLIIVFMILIFPFRRWQRNLNVENGQQEDSKHKRGRIWGHH